MEEPTMKGTLTTVIMLGGALSAGGAAAYLADGYIRRSVNERRAELDAQYETVSVAVANADLRPGMLLSNQTVALRDVPRAFLHAEAVPADRWTEIAGRILAHPVRGGEPLLRSHLAQNASAGFSTQLPDGMRALTFSVDEESSIAGMLAPGDRIDLFFTTTSNNEPVTLPLLVAVPVIATGALTTTNAAYVTDRQGATPYRTVTVAVTPNDAAKITLAQDAGKITIALRQADDAAEVVINRVTKNTLLYGSRPATSTARRPRIEVILGGA